MTLDNISTKFCVNGEEEFIFLNLRSLLRCSYTK